MPPGPLDAQTVVDASSSEVTDNDITGAAGVDGQLPVTFEPPAGVDPTALPYVVRHAFFDVVVETTDSFPVFKVVTKLMTVLPQERDRADPDSAWAAAREFEDPLTDPSADGKTLAEVPGWSRPWMACG